MHTRPLRLHLSAAMDAFSDFDLTKFLENTSENSRHTNRKIIDHVGALSQDVLDEFEDIAKHFSL